MHVVCIDGHFANFHIKIYIILVVVIGLAVIWCTPHALTLMIGCGLQIVNELPLFRL